MVFTSTPRGRSSFIEANLASTALPTSTTFCPGVTDTPRVKISFPWCLIICSGTSSFSRFIVATSASSNICVEPGLPMRIRPKASTLSNAISGAIRKRRVPDTKDPDEKTWFSTTNRASKSSIGIPSLANFRLSSST